HLVFAFGKEFLLRFLTVAGAVSGNIFGEVGTNVTAAGKDLCDGADEFAGGAVLGHVTRGAAFEDADGELVFGVHAEDEDREFGLGFADFAEDLEAAAA